MSIKRFLVNLFNPAELNRRVRADGLSTDERHTQEFEVEKERRRGLTGGYNAIGGG